jgi:hypothetical protein
MVTKKRSCAFLHPDLGLGGDLWKTIAAGTAMPCLKILRCFYHHSSLKYNLYIMVVVLARCAAFSVEERKVVLQGLRDSSLMQQ